MVKRFITVTSGSVDGIAFQEHGDIEIGKDWNNGSLNVSASSGIGSGTTNELAQGAFMGGLFRIPVFTNAANLSELETLADADALAAGTYNGQMFFLTGTGYSGADAITMSFFKRGNAMYMCRNGAWFHDYYPVVPPPPPTDFLVLDLTYFISFESTGGWSGLITDPTLAGFSDSWGNSSLAETYEHGQSYHGTISDPLLASFSDSWGDSSIAETYEHSQSYHGTISDPLLASFSDSWGDASLSGDIENW